MKKIVNDEDKKYEYTPESKSEFSNQNEGKDLGIPDKEKSEPAYKIVDPKKRMQMYIILLVSFILVIALIVINQTRTSTQKSEVVESLSYSNTYENTETIANVNTSNSIENSEKEVSITKKALPTYSIKGSWKGDNSNASVTFDGKGNFTYTWKYSKGNTIVYKGSYILRTGQGAYEAVGYSIDDVSNTFHISKTDINEANLMHIDCKPTEFSANGEPFKPVQQNDDEETSPIFTHLVYLTSDEEDKVIVKYYDDITQSVCILNNTESK